MHSIRTKKDGRGDTLMPNAEALALQNTPKPGFVLGIESLLEEDKINWTRVVTNPGPFCKNKLS